MKCYISNESLLRTLASCIETTEVRLVFVYDLGFGYCGVGNVLGAIP
jgi:hypothetical protein